MFKYISLTLVSTLFTYNAYAACAQDQEAYGLYPKDYICVNFKSKDNPVTVRCEGLGAADKLVQELERDARQITDQAIVSRAYELINNVQGQVAVCQAKKGKSNLQKWLENF